MFWDLECYSGEQKIQGMGEMKELECLRQWEITLGKAAWRVARLGYPIELCMNSICFGAASVTFGECLDASERPVSTTVTGG